MIPAMRVLVVTPYPALPLSHGGRVRTFGVAAGLAKAGADLTLLCPWSPGQQREAHDEDGVRIVPHVLPANVLLPVPDHWLPSIVAHSLQPFPRRLFSRLGTFDIVQFDFCAYPHWMRRLAGGPKLVYASHNVEADLFGAHAERSPFHRLLARRLRSLERDTVEASDLIVACTESDGARFKELYDAKAPIAIVPNGFDSRLLDGLPTREAARAQLGIDARETVLLFHGGAAEHNAEAVRFLTGELAPRLGPGTRLLLAGKAAEGSGGGSVTALGYVEDLRPLLAAADVGVNPVRHGSGSNIKIAEYLAAGLPVVTTAIGARGYESSGGRVRVAERAGFAAAVREAAAAPRARPEEIEALSWDRLAAGLAERYRRLK
jgi:glycosyltransferase involved in cell wall biosynthesis